MKSQKIITIVTVILLIAIISMASFVGIYKKQDYRVVNVVPNYKLGMEFENSRIVKFEVDNSVDTTIYDKDGKEVVEQDENIEYTAENGYTKVEEKVNSDEVLTKENFEKTKSILTQRLKKLGVEQYNIRQAEDGSINIQMPENDNTDNVIAYLNQRGNFELTDANTSEVLIDKSKIESVNVVYSQLDETSTQTAVYLQITFNKEGREKLKEISKIYIETTTQVTNEEGELEDKTETKDVSILIDGEVYRTTYFGQPITDGVLNIAIGSGENSEQLQQYIDLADGLQIILNGDVIPVAYKVAQNDTVSSAFSEQNILSYAIATILAIIFIYSIIKFKLKGIMVILLEVGYIGLLLLALRYTNIKITLEGIVGIIIAIILNYLYLYKAFNNIDKDFIKDITKNISLKLLPIYILAVIFTFNSILNISSLGMVLVWGILVMYLYNMLLANLTLKVFKD